MDKIKFTNKIKLQMDIKTDYEELVLYVRGASQ